MLVLLLILLQKGHRRGEDRREQHITCESASCSTFLKLWTEPLFTGSSAESTALKVRLRILGLPPLTV